MKIKEMTSNESEILKSKIKYLTDLINRSSTSKPSTCISIDQRQKPVTYSQLSNQHKHEKQEKVVTSSNPHLKGKLTSTFSWKKPAVQKTVLSLPKKKFDENQKNVPRNCDIPKPCTVASNAKQTSVAKSMLSGDDSTYKPENAKQTTDAKSMLSGDGSTYKPENENKSQEKFSCNRELGMTISNRLRNHPFMQRSKSNISQQASTDISSTMQKSKSNVLQLNPASTTPAHGQDGKTIRKSNSLTCCDTKSVISSDVLKCSSQERPKSSVNLKSKESSSLLSVKSRNDAVNAKKDYSKTLFSNKSMFKSLPTLDKHKDNGTSVKTKTERCLSENSPSKKEIMEVLNKKLSVAANKIEELKRQISFKSSNDASKTHQNCKNKVSVRQSSENKSGIKTSVEYDKQSNLKLSQSCAATCSENKHLLNQKGNSFSWKNAKTSPKSKYSVRKEETLVLQPTSSHPNTETNPIAQETASTSNRSTSYVEFNPKYKLRKGVTSSGKHESTSSGNAPLTDGKSKYHILSAEKCSSVKEYGSQISNTQSSLQNTNNERQFYEQQHPPHVYKSKYRLRKTSVNNLTSFSPRAGQAQHAVKVIKSKYKLRKVPQNVGHPVKKVPVKTVVKSRYKLQKFSKERQSSVSSILPYDTSIGNTNNSYIQKKLQTNKYDMDEAKYSEFMKYLRKRWPEFMPKSNEKKKRVQKKFYGHLNSFHQQRNRKTNHALHINKRYVRNHLNNSQNRSKTITAMDKSAQTGNRKNMKMVMINGMLYKSSGHSLVKTVPKKSSHILVKKLNNAGRKIITVRGVKFQMDSTGKTLQRLNNSPSKCPDSISSKSILKSSVHRVDIGGMTYVQTKPGTLEQIRSNKTKVIASRVKQRSIMTAAAKYKKDNTKKKVSKKYCMFFNRFGKCQRGNNCPYVHDPERVAICTRFLRGTCKIEDCPFSHKVAKEKMPTCSYFLRGVCNRDDCPYLHVNVSKTAKVCPDFVKGFCPLGEKCTKKHTMVCPSYSKTGVCTEEKPCKLKHIKKKQRYIKEDASQPSRSDKKVIKRKHSESSDECDIPFKQRKLPAYISIESDSENKTMSDIPSTNTGLLLKQRQIKW